MASRPAAIEPVREGLQRAGGAAVAGHQQHRAEPVLRDRLRLARRGPLQRDDAQDRRARQHQGDHDEDDASARGGEAGEHPPTVPVREPGATVRTHGAGEGTRC